MKINAKQLVDMLFNAFEIEKYLDPSIHRQLDEIKKDFFQTDNEVVELKQDNEYFEIAFDDKSIYISKSGSEIPKIYKDSKFHHYMSFLIVSSMLKGERKIDYERMSDFDKAFRLNRNELLQSLYRICEGQLSIQERGRSIFFIAAPINFETFVLNYELDVRDLGIYYPVLGSFMEAKRCITLADKVEKYVLGVIQFSVNNSEKSSTIESRYGRDCRRGKQLYFINSKVNIIPENLSFDSGKTNFFPWNTVMLPLFVFSSICNERFSDGTLRSASQILPFEIIYRILEFAYGKRLAPQSAKTLVNDGADDVRKVIKSIMDKANQRAARLHEKDVFRWEEIYREKGGSFLAAKSIFGWPKKQTCNVVLINLARRADNNGNGASQETLKAIGYYGFQK